MSLPEKLCKNFCVYYKPSKDEALACRGFDEVRSLLEKGMRIDFVNRRNPAGQETVRELKRKVCAACPFMKEDCDFMLMVAEASPCGGFLLLGQMLEDGIICVDEIGELD